MRFKLPLSLTAPPLLLLLLLVLLFLILIPRGQALLVKLEGGRNFCFYEAVERAPAPGESELPELELELEYLSVDRPVHAEAYEPSGRSLFRDELSREKRIRLPARTEGLYKVCFLNERYAEPLTTIFSLRTVVEVQGGGEEEVGRDDGSDGVGARASTGTRSRATVAGRGASLLKAVRRLKGQLLSLQEKQRYLLAREMLHGESNE